MNKTPSPTFTDVPIDAVREFWDRRPCNIRHSKLEVGSKEYFDEVAARRYFVEPHIKEFADFPNWAGKKVLEIGCGIGTDCTSFAKAGAQVTAIELSPKSLEIAKRQAAAYRLEDRISFFLGNAENLRELSIPQEYDLIYSCGVIHHTPSPKRALDCIRSLMIPGETELRLLLYNRLSYKLFQVMHESNSWDMSQIDQILSRYSEAQTNSPVTYSYTENSLRKLLSDFRLLQVEKAHIFTWDVEAYKQHEYVKAAPWKNVSDAELKEIASVLGWHFLVTCILD